MSGVADADGVRPLTARSAILSILLGAHPAEADGRSIVAWGARTGIRESAVRVALTRMVAAGDLERHPGPTYRLGGRLLERQARQDRAIEQRPGPWDGRWYVVAVTAVGADAATRAGLRQQMADDRFGELREGVWMRPLNLPWSPGPDVGPRVEVMRAVPERSSADLVELLFAVEEWAARAYGLIEALEAAQDPARRIAVAAAIVRHLVTDPVLPPELLGRERLERAWPGQRLRDTYAAFRAELAGQLAEVGPRAAEPTGAGAAGSCA